MVKSKDLKAPSFSLPSLSMVSSKNAYGKGAVLIVFYDGHGSDF
jgi:hypothetical protein